MAREVVLIGCSSIAPILKRAGWGVHEADYFWGSDDLDTRWAAAIVDIAVGGETGLQVAERLDRCGVMPLVLHARSEQHQVSSRFVGVSRASVGSARFFLLLELCAEETEGRTGDDDGSVIDAEAMIVAEQSIPDLVHARRAPTVRGRPPEDTDQMQ